MVARIIRGLPEKSHTFRSCEGGGGGGYSFKKVDFYTYAITFSFKNLCCFSIHQFMLDLGFHQCLSQGVCTFLDK